MTDSTLTIRVPAQLKEDFLDAARSRDRTAAQLLRDFMRDYAAPDLPQPQDDAHLAYVARKVAAARRSLAKGDFVSNEDVEAEFAARRAALLAKAAKAA